VQEQAAEPHGTTVEHRVAAKQSSPGKRLGRDPEELYGPQRAEDETSARTARVEAHSGRRRIDGWDGAVA